MRSGQLKPAYNVQIGVNSGYITGAELFPGRMDGKPLPPFLKQMEQHDRYQEVAAGAGYESLDNYLFLDSTGQVCFIRSSDYDRSRSQKCRKEIGRIENMEYGTEEDCFLCTQGRRLSRGGRVLNSGTDRCPPPHGTAVTAVMDVPADLSAAGQRTQQSPEILR